MRRTSWSSKSAVALTSKSDYPAVAQFSVSSLKVLHAVMSQTDQLQLYHAATRALTIAKRRGDMRTVEYWSGQPIVSLEALA